MNDLSRRQRKAGCNAIGHRALGAPLDDMDYDPISSSIRNINEIVNDYCWRLLAGYVTSPTPPITDASPKSKNPATNVSNGDNFQGR
jgi:hypothetical protein